MNISYSKPGMREGITKYTNSPCHAKVLFAYIRALERQLFTSRFASILTFMGVAIGLGNVWRFPYMMGKYGGSAFLAVYVIFTFLFAIPALMAEMTLGRMGGKGTVHAFRLAFGVSTGSVVGYLLLLVITVAGSYYAVVVTNVVFTTGFSMILGFSPEVMDDYHMQLSNGWLQYGMTLLIIGASCYTIHKGLSKGIERVSRIFMPLFFLVLVYIIIRALALPNAVEKCLEFLKPDFSLLGSEEIFGALGQAFFSVGLGGTFVIVYAAFLKPDESIPRIALFTGLGDLSASFLISLFLVPSVLVFGLDMASGPGLIFETFPRLFHVMPGGRLIGSLFLLIVSVVAFLSLVAAYQVPFTSLQDEQSGWDRKKILFLIGGLQALLALPSCLYPALIGTLDLIFGSGMQVVGSALTLLGLTWIIGKKQSQESMFSENTSPFVKRTAFYWIKFVIPTALVIVLLNYIYDIFY